MNSNKLLRQTPGQEFPRASDKKEKLLVYLLFRKRIDTSLKFKLYNTGVKYIP